MNNAWFLLLKICSYQLRLTTSTYLLMLMTQRLSIEVSTSSVVRKPLSWQAKLPKTHSPLSTVTTINIRLADCIISTNATLAIKAWPLPLSLVRVLEIIKTTIALPMSPTAMMLVTAIPPKTTLAVCQAMTRVLVSKALTLPCRLCGELLLSWGFQLSGRKVTSLSGTCAVQCLLVLWMSRHCVSVKVNWQKPSERIESLSRFKRSENPLKRPGFERPITEVKLTALSLPAA